MIDIFFGVVWYMYVCLINILKYFVYYVFDIIKKINYVFKGLK